jgi:uncharacterized membrane protein YesL
MNYLKNITDNIYYNRIKDVFREQTITFKQWFTKEHCLYLLYIAGLLTIIMLPNIALSLKNDKDVFSTVIRIFIYWVICYTFLASPLVIIPPKVYFILIGLAHAKQMNDKDLYE